MISMNKFAARKFSKGQLWLCLPWLVSYAADVMFTLLGQTSNYWAGDYRAVNEANPSAHFLMRIHPGLFIAYQIFIFCVVALVIALLPLKASKVLAVFMFLMNTIGAYTWLRGTYQVDFMVRQGLLIIPAILLVYAFARVDRSSTLRQ